ncbi:MAG: hypothetical protein K0S11_1777 [Gammaproteobacteria bacterium]|jgi:hypothetical protein|nr:hypothetical protein [Gammaproteobacteria bacterium]
MYKAIKLILFYSIFLSLGGVINASEVSHDNVKFNKADNKPITVSLGTYLFDIDNFKLSEGSYEMLFYLAMHCQPDCSRVQLELMNGAILSKETIISKPKSQFYRIRALLNTHINYQRFPFDSHQLTIMLEDKFLDKDTLIFSADANNTGLDNSIILLGWDEKPFWLAEVSNSFYPIYNQTYSRYIFSVNISKPILAGLLKNILPGVLIMAMGFLPLLLSHSKVLNGLPLVSSALITMALFHINATSAIPPTRYITYLDGFMLVNYLGLLFVLSREVASLSSIKLKTIRMLSSKKYYLFIPLLWLTLQGINFLSFFV